MMRSVHDDHLNKHRDSNRSYCSTGTGTGTSVVMASTSTKKYHRSSNCLVVLPRRCRLLMLLLVAVAQLFTSLSSSSSSVGSSNIFVEAVSFENTTTVTLKNTKITASSVQQVQGKILYDAGYLDLSSLVFSVTGGDSSSAASSNNNNNNGETSTEFYYMDLAIFQVPEICSDDDNITTTTQQQEDDEQGSSGSDSTIITRRHCDGWAEPWTLGISIPGKNSLGEPELWWCCTKNVMEYGACTQEQYGRLLVNETLFQGQRVSLQIPAATFDFDFSSPLPDTASGFGFTQAGIYTLIMANCHEEARDVIVNGDTVWMSWNEVELVEEAIPFYVVLGVGYVILLSWFWYLLQANKSSRIKLEEWIFATIALGFFEMLFRTIDFFVWGSNGTNVPILSLVAMIVSAAKHSFGRCLLLMVAMGWGVVRASLARHTFMGIVAMGTCYLVASCVFDIYYTIDWGGNNNNDDNSSSIQGSGAGEQQETALGDLVQICFWLSFYIDIVFLIWIPSAMVQTMHYLKTTNQLRKLERYQVLLKIMMVAVLLTIITIILVFTQAFGLNFMDVGEGNEINFFIILTFVAVVWRPNPNAREFAYVMELGTSDDDNGMTDLELVADSACDFQQQQEQSRRSNNGTYEGGGAVSIDRAEPA